MSLYLEIANFLSQHAQTAPIVQQTSPLGMQLIEYFEGIRLSAYLDSSGIWTIGLGHTQNVSANQTITFDQAVAFLADDLKISENTILKNVTTRLKQNQFDAIVSFVFNIGSGNFLKSSVYQDLKKSNFDKIPYDLSLWNRSGGRVVEGLVTRRHAEGILFSEGRLDLAPSLVPDNLS